MNNKNVSSQVVWFALAFSGVVGCVIAPKDVGSSEEEIQATDLNCLTWADGCTSCTSQNSPSVATGLPCSGTATATTYLTYTCPGQCVSQVCNGPDQVIPYVSVNESATFQFTCTSGAWQETGICVTSSGAQACVQDAPEYCTLACNAVSIVDDGGDDSGDAGDGGDAAGGTCPAPIVIYPAHVENLPSFSSGNLCPGADGGVIQDGATQDSGAHDSGDGGAPVKP